MRTPLVLLVLFFCHIIHADYAWLPESQNLWLKTGWEMFLSSANYSPDGVSTDLRTASNLSDLRQNQFFLDAEYGLGDNWSSLIRTNFLAAQIQSTQGTSLLAGSGLADTSLGFKWQARREKPVLALEVAVVFPPYSSTNLTNDELSLGDGVAGTTLVAHLGTKTKRFAFSTSPGLLFRYGRFSHQATLESAISLVLKKFYFRAFQWAAISLSREASSPSLQVGNSELGSGGSFSRLSTAPDLLLFGLKAGYRISEKFRLEGNLAKTVWGRSSADSIRFGVALISYFDFFVPDTREKIREVPLNPD